MSEKMSFPSTAEQYELVDEVGQGASATVYHAKVKETGQSVAIKVIDLEQFSTTLDEIRLEIQLMSQAQHDNVVRFYGSFVQDQCLWLIMNYLSGGSVHDLMKFAYQDGLQEAQIATILQAVLKGVVYFHSSGQIHRDIKAGNILLDPNGSIQLADFGVSGNLVEGGARRDKRQTFVGTLCYMAPEVMEQESGYNTSADIWSLGITALELAHGQAPFAKFPPLKVMLQTLQNPPPTLDMEHSAKKFSPAFKDFVDCCLCKDPQNRPSAAKLLEHKFIKQAKKADVICKQLLSKLPSLPERTKTLRDRQEQSRPRAPAAEPYVQGQSSEWDFPEKGKSVVFAKNVDEESEPTKDEVKKGRFVVSEPMEDISDSDDGEEAKKPDEHSENEEEEEEEDDKNAGVMRLLLELLERSQVQGQMLQSAMPKGLGGEEQPLSNKMAQLAAEAQKLENRVQELENENKLLKETLIQHSIALPIALEHEEESGSEKGEASDVEAKEAISAEDSVHSSDDEI